MKNCPSPKKAPIPWLETFGDVRALLMHRSSSPFLSSSMSLNMIIKKIVSGTILGKESLSRFRDELFHLCYQNGNTMHGRAKQSV